MKVVVNRDSCRGCLLCTDTCPEVFKEQPGEITILYEDVPPAFEMDCRYAREICPSHAVKIRDAAGVYRYV